MMSRLSKIFLVIIIILAIALGIMVHYYSYWKEAYLSAANQMIKVNERLERVAEAENRNAGNVKIEVIKDTITPTGGTIRITDNNEYPYIWREDYMLKIKENGVWEDVEKLEDIDFDQTPFNLNENNQVEQKLNWTKLYGTLPKGTYMIQKFTYTSNEDLYLDSNEFEIK